MKKELYPLPWSRTVDMRGISNQPVEGVQAADGATVANCGVQGSAQANRIIKAVNNHQPLIDALDKVETMLYQEHPEGLPMQWRFISAVIAEARK